MTTGAAEGRCPENGAKNHAYDGSPVQNHTTAAVEIYDQIAAKNHTANPRKMKIGQNGRRLRPERGNSAAKYDASPAKLKKTLRGQFGKSYDHRKIGNNDASPAKLKKTLRGQFGKSYDETKIGNSFSKLQAGIVYQNHVERLECESRILTRFQRYFKDWFVWQLATQYLDKGLGITKIGQVDYAAD